MMDEADSTEDELRCMRAKLEENVGSLSEATERVGSDDETSLSSNCSSSHSAKSQPPAETRNMMCISMIASGNQRLALDPAVPARCRQNSEFEDDDSFPFFNSLDEIEDAVEPRMEAQPKNRDAAEDVLGRDTLPPQQQDVEKPSQYHQRSQSPTSIAASETELFPLDDVSVQSQAKQSQPSHALPSRAPLKDPVAERRPFDESDQVLQKAEVHFSLFEPPPYVHRQDPIVHHFTLLNRPSRARRNIPVSQVYDQPVRLLWKNKFESFNHMQSEIANVLAHSNDNLVVSAPTGAGKTAVFEMAMARLFGTELHEQAIGRNNQLSKRRKIVYIAPSKALCEERFEDWSSRLSQMKLGIEVALITGDGEHSDSFRDAVAAHVILTTPEKWDSLTRRWTEIFFLFASVKLFLIDEVHLLGDDSRGCCLESIVCRMKTIQRAATAIRVTGEEIQKSSYTNTTPEVIASSMRIVAVSATLPNLSDVASFLDASEAYLFDESYRPVPLTTHVKAFGFVGNKEYFFWNSLSKKVPEVIRSYSMERPTIVFCHSKKEAENLAELLATERGVGYSHGTVKSDIAAQSKVTKLQKVLLRGIAFHHAGLEASDRRLVEKAFEAGQLRCLCATTTLAMGVNLPAHLVIVKGTRTWRGGYEDIDAGTLLQMIGRAGRPGYDTSGTAVIMTDNNSKLRIETLSACGLGAADSQLRHSLVEVLNTEISQRVITSSLTALNWLKGTFFYVRANKNPTSCGVHVVSAQSLDAHLMYLCETALKQLRDNGIIELDNESGLVPLPASHIMSQHMVAFDAMKILVALPFDTSQCQVLEALSGMERMQKPVRRDEKKHLNEAHKVIKYKLKGPASKTKIQTPSQKAFVLLQAAVGQHYFDESTLRQEMSTMVEFSCRILAAAEEYSFLGSKHGRVALQCLKLRRALATSLWSENDGILNQLRGVGQSTAGCLRLHGITHFRDVLRSSEEELETKGRRLPPFGTQLRAAVLKILLSTLILTASHERSIDASVPSTIVCSLKRNDSMPNHDPLSVTVTDKKTSAITYTLLAFTDRPGGCLFFQSNITSPREITFRCPEKFGRISIHLVASLVGLDEKAVIDGYEPVATSVVTKTPPPIIEKQSKKRIRDSSRWLKQSCTQLEAHHRNNPLRDFIISGSLKAAAATRPAEAGRNAAERARGQMPIFDKSQVVTPSPKVAPVAPHSREIQTEFPNKRLLTLGNSNGAPHSESSRTNPIEHSRIPESGGTSIPGFARAVPSPQNRSKTAGAVPWKREKREHQKSQQTAFAKRTDNPFSLFRFDPNAIESNIEALSSSTLGNTDSSGIIPPETLFTFHQATTANSGPRVASSKSVVKPTRTGYSGGPLTRRVRRRREFISSATERDFLRMKADEADALSATRIARQTQNMASPVPRSQFPVSKNQDSHYGVFGNQESAQQTQSRFWPQNNETDGRSTHLHATALSGYGVCSPQFTDSYQGIMTQPTYRMTGSNPSSQAAHQRSTYGPYQVAHHSHHATTPNFQAISPAWYTPNVQSVHLPPHSSSSATGIESAEDFDPRSVNLHPNYCSNDVLDPSRTFQLESIGETMPYQTYEGHPYFPAADSFGYSDERDRNNSYQMQRNMEEDREFDEAFF